MAGISVAGSEGGKKSVDSEIPLIPFIDLLLCCIMFLLVTAVWNKLAAVDANANGSSPQGHVDGPPPPRPTVLRVFATGYVIVGPAGDEVRIEREASAPYDVVALRQRLRERRSAIPNERSMLVTADDGVVYAELVHAMDALSGAGYEGLTVSDTTL